MPDRSYFDIPEDEYIFRQSGDFSLWTCVSHVLWDGLTLADVLQLFDVVIDQNCQFCRIIRYDGDYVHTLTYRAYNGAKITLSINHSKFI